MDFGVNFPLDEEGKRSTTSINQGAIAAASSGADEKLGEAVRVQRGWRRGYAKHVVAQVETAMQSREKALGIAEAGIEYMHSKMIFARQGAPDMSLAEAMKSTSQPFKTGTLQGKAPRKPTLDLAYKGNVLSHLDLRRQVDTWVRRGVIEMSAGEAICTVANRSDWLDLSDLVFVLFGAASAMGPFSLLMKLGAHVIALDLDRPAVWNKLFDIGEKSPGKLTFPLKEECAREEWAHHAGCNLLTQPAEVKNWILAQCGSMGRSQQLICGSYCYLDGALFVRISVAMDIILQSLIQEHKNVMLAYLCTPSDTHVIPPEASHHAVSNRRSAPLWQLVFSLKSNIRKELPESGLRVVDAIIPEQGPNYLLAKRLQHWRAIVAREKHNLRVSTNVAPSTTTASVMSNRSIALATAGMHHFKPIEIFEQETSNTVMGALLINDIRSPISPANPSVALNNPMELFMYNACHGGVWRSGWKFGSLGLAACIVHLFVHYICRGYLLAYSIAQFLGWTYVLKLVGDSISTGSSLYATAGPSVIYFQILMYLDVLHVILGLVPGAWPLAALQVSSRIAVLINIIYADQVATFENSWMLMMFCAWGIAEMIRYSFYACNILGRKIYVLTWIRYTLFIVLYPLGVSGELGVLWNTMDRLDGITDGVLLYYKSLLQMGGWPFITFMYLVGFPPLYLHMLKLRKKVIGGSGWAPSKDKRA